MARSITGGGCPCATTPAVPGDSPREDVLKTELALCFEKASREFLAGVRNPVNATAGLDANTEASSEAECASSPLCRRHESALCDASRPYREADGRCNNLEHPEWGAAGACMQRLLSPAYADGVSSPRVSAKSGRALPSARRVSYTVHPERTFYDESWSAMTVHFAQFIAHDISAALVVDPGGPEFSKNLGRDTYKCCDEEYVRSGPECFPIDVGAEDPFYGRYNVRCMNFKRSAPCLKCRLADIQLSDYYFTSRAVFKIYKQIIFRFSYVRWLLKEQLINHSRLLPPSSNPQIDQCSKQREHRFCFEGGDHRVNQNSGLLMMHTIWFREHNRVARKLARINPHWDDERLFQVSRRIVEARLQHIVYKELLKYVLGPKGVKQNKLNPLTVGYTTYDAGVDATVYNDFTTAAFRMGHSLIDADNETMCLPGNRKLSLPLRHNWFNPFAFYEADVVDAVTGSRLRKPSQQMDRQGYGTYDVTRHAFRVPNGPKPFGVDLFAFDIQRGRDHGLRPYVDYATKCTPGVSLGRYERRRYPK
ncbi:hypothetical protein HPB50_013519 [Hyalomma asiaticum]|uniref:Uncharacterized protein n=1 Tax=Hyalomma asiaticum TaxID=266040 RepID=A0ACB7RKU6_HYAAI|nr:hypothetical protein HPB50_013519 [Hyalomma asiaticum]